MSCPANELLIHGLSVKFPNGKKPFPAQLAVISKALQAVKEKKNALLESPTGTGKTLALLSSTIAYQQYIEAQRINNHNLKCESKQELADDIGMESKATTVSKVESKETLCSQAPKPPKIYYCSRTHTQLQQVIDELRNCHEDYSIQPNMCLLGARKHYCINDKAKELAEAQNNGSLDEICRDMAEIRSCPFARSVKQFDDLASRLTTELKVWDIEDAVMAGEKYNACPYFASKSVFENAQIIFCPYNYVIDSGIRRAMNISLGHSIVIFDEAHNIEDTARDAGSIDVTWSAAKQAQIELAKMMHQETNLLNLQCTSLHGLISNLIQWIKDMSVDLFQSDSHENSTKSYTPDTRQTQGRTPQKYGSSMHSGNTTSTSYQQHLNECIWEGSEFLSIFEERYNLNETTLQMYRQYYENIVEEQEEEMENVRERMQGASSDDNKNQQENVQEVKLRISSQSIALLRQYITVLEYMFGQEKVFADDFRVVIQKEESYGNEYKRNSRRTSKSGVVSIEADHIPVTFHIWCLSASVVFREISEKADSVLLTSGTLSPLDSFAGELGTSFPVRVEASHVINLSNQLLVGMISTFRDYSLNSTYQCQQADSYLDLIGEALASIIKLTPGGVLLFVPSYALLNRLKLRWAQTRLIRRIDIESAATVFFEQKDAKGNDKMLLEYYRQLDDINTKAALIAVHRGKVSEGMNFSDHYARVVILVGIPFPSVGDLKVNLKRRYQDCKHAKDSNIINGESWYRQQAFRAINQAIGRCIRHRHDYGSIVLLDPRFQKDNIISQLSRWMRSEARVYEHLESFLPQLETFFGKRNDSYAALLSEGGSKAAKAEKKEQHKIEQAMKKERRNKKKEVPLEEVPEASTTAKKPGKVITLTQGFFSISRNKNAAFSEPDPAGLFEKRDNLHSPEIPDTQSEGYNDEEEEEEVEEEGCKGCQRKVGIKEIEECYDNGSASTAGGGFIEEMSIDFSIDQKAISDDFYNVNEEEGAVVEEEYSKLFELLSEAVVACVKSWTFYVPSSDSVLEGGYPETLWDLPPELETLRLLFSSETVSIIDCHTNGCARRIKASNDFPTLSQRVQKVCILADAPLSSEFVLVDEWCPRDSVVYQFICCNLEKDSEDRNAKILLAAKVLAASEDRVQFIGQVFAHPIVRFAVERVTNV